jgi:hypothetical protein
LTSGSAKRYVQLIGRDDREPLVALDQDGFLDLASQSDFLDLADLLDADHGFVLLSSGGTGKTTLLREARDQEQGTWIPLLELQLGEIRAALSAALDAAKPVYLDGLDEAARFEPRIFHVLQSVFSSEGARTVRWRLGCRPEAWNHDLTGLAGLRECRLLPLTRQATHDLVSGAGIDAQFLDALTEAGLGRLSASPMHLRDAALQWHATGRLPTSRTASLDFEIGRLLAETDRSRPQARTPADRRRRVAGRLATIAMFTRVRGFSFGPTAAESVLSVDGLPSQPDPDDVTAPVDPQQYRDVLASALFEPSAHGTMTFRHLYYAEHLAAEYVSRSPLGRSHITALFDVTDGVVPGSMASLASRLVALRPDLARMLLPRNALTLLAADVELPAAVREQIVTALLDSAKAGDAEPYWGVDLGKCDHPGLEEQLRRCLDEGLTEAYEVWWISSLATIGRCSSLNEDLLGLALDAAWPDWARRAATLTIIQNGTNLQKEALRPLLELDAEQDPDDELLATVLTGLYPSALTTAELFQALRRPRNKIYLGTYYELLRDLGKRIPANDLPQALAWITKWRGITVAVEARTDFSDLAAALIQRAWTARNDPTTHDSLADYLALVGSDIGVRPYSRAAAAPWRTDRDDRRRLAVAVAHRINEFRWFDLLRVGLIDETDFDWLLTELNQQPAAARNALGRCLANFVGNSPAPQRPELQQRIPADHPAQAHVTARLAALDQQERDEETYPDPDATALLRLRAALAQAETDLGSWWRITESVVDGGPADGLFDCDLTALQGWAQLTIDEQQRILVLGLDYVCQHVPSPSAWSAATSWSTEQVLPDQAGVYLLTTLARRSPDRLDDLALDCWKTWAPTVVAMRASVNEHFTASLLDAAPAAVRSYYIEALLNQLDDVSQQGMSHPRSSLYRHLADELLPAVRERLLAGRYSGPTAIFALDLVVRNQPSEAAINVCRTLAGGQDSLLSPAAMNHLNRLDPGPRVRNLVANPPTGDSLPAALRGVDPDALDSTTMRDLAMLLLDRFPVEQDPRTQPHGFTPVDPVHEARELRGRIVGRMAHLGLTSDLKLLAEGRSGWDRKWINHFLRLARQRAADLAAEQAADDGGARPSVNGLLALLSRGDVRMVRHGADALNVLVDRIEDLQHEITNETGFRDLWNEKAPKSEDDITDWLRRRLNDRLHGSGIIDREVSVRRLKDRGAGTRIDMTLTVLKPDDRAPVTRVTVEAKLVSNDELPTAMQDQLVNRYLIPTGQQHGILLVYWLPLDQRPASWWRRYPSKDDLIAELQLQADRLAPTFDIRPVVLDISRPIDPSR